ncbi:hypothetical protein FSPOR_9353 [Fusarium sporotrichioides]|uniref:Microtubule associated protein n=1 Tax=Fusarium sporotrichioides TaxID=5514 RepID=A0A395RQ96_FUSSP|nr:hypothetical protein FSPOR_9353 [Fusarium sporotrichioides]
MTSDSTQASPSPTRLQRLSRAVGFTKSYNFILWLLFGGAFLAFTLSRFIYLDFNGHLCPSEPPTSRIYGSRGAVPGECYYYRHGIGKAGIIMHLAGILPAAVLVVFQFIPAIRHRALLVHRISGYVILLLSVVGIIGVFMITRHAFGGTLEMQTVTSVASIMFTVCIVLAYINIKRLQLEQHRAWMLRGWIVAGHIITMRAISAIMAQITSQTSPYSTVTPCAVLDSMFHHNKPAVEALYPGCVGFYTGETPDQRVITEGIPGERPDAIAARLNSAFGASAWLALLVHVIAAEVYLRLTPAEAERLRKVSYRRQMEAGISDPGNSGLTVQRLGDAEPWTCLDDGDVVRGETESMELNIGVLF